MKNIFKLLFVYMIGMLFVVTCVWRANCLDNSHKLADNTTTNYVYND